MSDLPWIGVLCLTAALLTSCQGSRPPSGPGAETEVQEKQISQPAAFSSEPRRVKPRAELPEAIQSLLPRQGIYAAGGGLTSSAWRVVLDLDGELYGGSAKGANKPSFGAMDEEQRRRISGRELASVIALADEVWREKREPNLSPIADYDEIVAIVDGDEAFFLQGYGPIRGGAAAELIERLRGLAGI
jgi:hypothetical protein